MTETTTLMTIGEFSSLSRLSVRMLRHYDSHGVLVPTTVDHRTGYRRYSPEQLGTAASIRNLRDVGFGVSAIAALLAARGTPAWTSALDLQRRELVGELDAARSRLSLITRLLTEGESTMSITVDRTTVPAILAVALRGTVPTYADEGLLWQRLMPALAEQGVAPIGPCGVIEHDEEFTEQDVDLEIFAPVAPGTVVAEPLHLIELPARDCLVATVHGPYDRISAAHDLINKRIVAEQLSPAGGGALASKAFNRYLTTPDQVGPEELITEVCQPLG